MMEQKQQLQYYLQQFRLGGIPPALDTIIAEAEAGALGYMEYTLKLLAAEAAHRAQNDLNRRLKEARLPRSSDLESYDYSFGSGLSKTRMNQLRELHWLDQVYNIILMGPSGVGKSRVAAGLCAEALGKGYRAYFRTMEEIMSMLKMKEVTRAARSEYGRLSRAHLIVIDDIMLFPVEKAHPPQADCSTSLTSSMKKHLSLLPPIRSLRNGHPCWEMRCWPRPF